MGHGTNSTRSWQPNNRRGLSLGITPYMMFLIVIIIKAINIRLNTHTKIHTHTTKIGTHTPQK